MPPSEVIAESIATMARELVGLAIAWHVVLLAVGVAVAIRQRSTYWILLATMVALALSVSIASFSYGNPFNGTSFAVLALALALGAARPHRTDAPVPLAVVLVGVAAIVYGWTYSHFANGLVQWAAPIGVIPCPTLAVLGGAAIITGGLGSRWLLGMLAVWTAFYASVGVFVLHVWADAGLAFVALTLVALALHHHYRGLFVHRRPA